MKLIKKLKIDVIATSSVMVALGVIMLLWPAQTQSYICYCLACLAIAVGICFSVDYRKKDALSDERNYSLACSMAAVLMGILVLVHADTVIENLPLFLSFLVLFSGLIKVQNAWDMKKLKENSWSFHLVVAIVGVVFGFLLMLGLLEDHREVWIGVGLIYAGFTDLISFFTLSKTRKEVERRGNGEM